MTTSSSMSVKPLRRWVALRSTEAHPLGDDEGSPPGTCPDGTGRLPCTMRMRQPNKRPPPFPRRSAGRPPAWSSPGSRIVLLPAPSQVHCWSQWRYMRGLVPGHSCGAATVLHRLPDGATRRAAPPCHAGSHAFSYRRIVLGEWGCSKGLEGMARRAQARRRDERHHLRRRGLAQSPRGRPSGSRHAPLSPSLVSSGAHTLQM